MILCLDCGNSRLKWGARVESQWRASGTLAYADVGQLRQQLPSGFAPLQVIGCNVAGPDRAAQIEAVLGVPVHWITARALQCGVANAYAAPEKLGADRWAALLAADAVHAGPMLVVLAGTATTIDVLDAGGQHRGGVILPGLALMAASLASGTAGLPLAQGTFQSLPCNTHDAIASGALQATLGAIERMYRLLPVAGDPLCLLAGGAAESLLPHLDLPFRHIESLVLDGLARIATSEHPA